MRLLYHAQHSFALPFSDGYLMLQKQSANPTMTDNNSCYSLKGAVYGVYTSKSDANADTNRVATLETLYPTGDTDVIKVSVGT